MMVSIRATLAVRPALTSPYPAWFTQNWSPIGVLLSRGDPRGRSLGLCGGGAGGADVDLAQRRRLVVEVVQAVDAVVEVRRPRGQVALDELARVGAVRVAE